MSRRDRFHHLLKSGFRPIRPFSHFALIVEDSVTGEKSVHDESLVCVLEKSGENIDMISVTDLLFLGSVQMITDL